MKLVGNTSNTTRKAVVLYNTLQVVLGQGIGLFQQRGPRAVACSAATRQYSFGSACEGPRGRSLDWIHNSELTVRPLVGVDVT
jgi:hypothetical protein